MEAVIFFTAVTFVVAMGSAIIQGVIFWKRYRIRFHVTNKTPSINSRDLESQDSGLQPRNATTCPHVVATPMQRLRHESINPRRWPSGYYDPASPHWTSADRRHQSNTIATFAPGPTLLEGISERCPSPTTISLAHLTPATEPRDLQGFVEQNPNPIHTTPS
ncbi:hypothetical protein N7494_008855 [Penicillium frequentans]|uniref:Uncharacterized protein n=1 Tax=Penicillium frequentans TaxID=3151616 RepID=A0AAD6CRI9_9EURO|nr:hypothetical protein N7494_008855 [Penicillium glabrum]